jgi:hypothetical protein
VAGIVIWLLFCGCQSNAVPDSEYGGFGFMPNPSVYSTYLCGLELAELGTHGSEDDFVKMRSERDKQLAVPKLILPALQINIRAGQMPQASDECGRFLKLPINKL